MTTITPTRRHTRSCLIVPGNKPSMHERAVTTSADEVVFDLEDAVPVAEKPAARAAVIALLTDPRWRERRVAVRVNAPGTPAHTADLIALSRVDHPAWSAVVPKVERTGELVPVVAALTGVAVQALIESPRGLLAAGEIACHDAVSSLILGYADLAAGLGRRPNRESIDDWRFQRELLVAAARAGGAAAIDGPFFALRDLRGLGNASLAARAAGFDGKWAIHPEQVAVIEAAFAPTADELSWAREVVHSLSVDGAASVGGAMVDEAMARSARRLLVLGDVAGRVGGGAPSAHFVSGSREPRVGLVRAPYYDELTIGQVLHGPGVTLSPGHAALHQAVLGDRLRLALDGPLAEAVTGRPGVLAHPMLVCDVAIGQSTRPSGRVLGNLFYRGLGCRPLHLGATLRTRTKVVARRDVSGGRGIAALRVTSTDQDGTPVLDFWRCPLLPARPGTAPVGAADDLKAVGAPADPHDYIPRDWNLAPLREAPLGPLLPELSAGEVFEVEAGETITCAPELARLTLNLATTHTDARGAVYGERLVYGGHVVGIAAAHLTRALPDLATILVWDACEHLGPSFEGDILTSRIEIIGIEPLTDGGLLRLQIHVVARSLGGLDRNVLDWTLVALMP